jgi:hypothetical protein
MVQQKDHEEVVEMKEQADGTFYPVTLVKINNKPHPSLQGISPNAFPPHIPRWIPATYQLIDGFIMGLGAIENFVVNVRKLKKGRKP